MLYPLLLGKPALHRTYPVFRGVTADQKTDKNVTPETTTSGSSAAHVKHEDTFQRETTAPAGVTIGPDKVELTPNNNQPVSTELPALVLEKNLQKLIKTLDLRYKITVMTNQQSWAGLTPIRAAEALKVAPLVAVGDAHASALKILETLILANMVTMPPNQAKDFINHYEKLANSKLSPEEFIETDQKLANIIQSVQWTGGNRQFLLIGDTLSDRGPSDTVVLNLISHLRQQAPANILEMASNHNENVIDYLIYRRLRPRGVSIDLILSEQSGSMRRPLQIYSKDRDKYLKLIDQYAEHAQHYELLKRIGPTLVAHAPIENSQLDKLHGLLPNKDEIALPSRMTSEAEMDQFIEAANHFYRQYNQEAFDLVKLALQNKDKAQSQAFEEKKQDFLKQWKKVKEALNGPYDNGFLWTRSTLYIPKGREARIWPFYKAGIRNLVHGHDADSGVSSPFSVESSEKDPRCTVINLDQNVRKDIAYDLSLTQKSLLSLKSKSMYPESQQSKIFAIF